MIYSLTGVTKQYRAQDGLVRALDGLTFGIGAGECVALIGKSGAGKSTLFRLLNATQRPTAGLLEFSGSDVGQMSSRKLRGMRCSIGTVYQQHHLVPSLSVLDNALCGYLGRWTLLQTLRNSFRPPRHEVEEAMQVLDAVGLADKHRSRADELSGGQQQRLAIARALMNKPDVILADEPVASLDPALAESITSLLVNIATESKRTLIVSLHAVDLARHFFPRVVALRDGQLAFDVNSNCLDQDIVNEVFLNASSNSTHRGQLDVKRWSRINCTC